MLPGKDLGGYPFTDGFRQFALLEAMLSPQKFRNPACLIDLGLLIIQVCNITPGLPSPARTVFAFHHVNHIVLPKPSPYVT